jgi:DNA-directed RNA polymerase specialized sigma24 family protein
MDEAILASLDRDPDAFAEFFRRHAGRLLSEFAGRTQSTRLAADLCAESFAAALTSAHRFDPRRGPAGDWLDAIAEDELAHAERTGAARDRARRRLGLAALEPPGDARLAASVEGFVADRDSEEFVSVAPSAARFIAELEEELVEAARFRAARQRPRPRPRLPPLPRPPSHVVRGALAGVAAVALAAVVAVIALGGDDEPRPRAAATGPSARLVAMLPPPRCFARVFDERPASPAIPYFSVFDYRPRVDDMLPGDLAESLPIASYDPRETKLAANGRRGTRLHLVPSLGVSEDRSCAADDGPGVCMVADSDGRYRCFGIERIRDGLAFARTERGSIAGIVTDGIGRVTLSAGGQRASAAVAGNVYEAELGVAPGTRVAVELAPAGDAGCEREVAPGLLARVAALRRAPTDRLVPMAALSRLREDYRIAEVVERGARFWGADGGVDFWVVPVAETGPRECAPATAVCVVAVTVGGRADAECGMGAARDRPNWRFAPLLPEHAAIYGTVPEGVVAARLTLGTRGVDVPVRDNVIAAVLPFPYEDGVAVRLIRRAAPAPPRVGIVDAGGDAEAMRDRLIAAGYEPLGAIVPGVKRQSRTVAYWRPRLATLAEAAAVARAAGAAELIRIANAERTPRPVLDAAAPLVVVVGGS